MKREKQLAIMEMKMSNEHVGRLDEIAASDLTTGWCFQEDEHFEALFLDNGPALVVASRLHCGRESWQLEFAADVLEPVYGNPDRVAQREYSVKSGDAFWSQSPRSLVVEAAAVVGPIRGGECYSVHDQAVGALSHMRELLLEQIDEALSCSPRSIFNPEFSQWMADELPSSETLLTHLVSLGQTMTSPAGQEFLKLLASSKRRCLH
jgi:hypothetical protein